jgi:hypothetical protein
MEHELEKKGSIFKQRDSKWEELEPRLNVILEEDNNNKIIKLNINGKKYSTSLKTISNTPGTLFYKLIHTPDLDLNREIFIERSNKYFSHILNYLRNKKINLTQFNKAELEELKEEALFYEIEYIINKLGGRPKKDKTKIEIVNLFISGTYKYNDKDIGSNTLEDLVNEDLNKGVCVNNNGWIILELNNVHKVDSIDIAGFTGSNNNVWYPGNGVGATIYTSTDKENWESVGKIDSTFKDKIVNIKLEKTKCKFIKFSESPLLGLGYVKVNKAILSEAKAITNK